MFESLYQSFTDTADASQSAARVAALRAELKTHGLDGFIVPRADRHQNEYVPPSEERLAWLTGFTGSAGLAIVLQDRAALFVDGRYTIQVREQVDLKVVEPVALAYGRARKNGSKPICAPARSSATIPGFTRQDKSNATKKPPKQPVLNSLQSSKIRSMRSGRTVLRRRTAPSNASAETSRASRARKTRARHGRARQGRRVADQRSSCGGVGFQHPRHRMSTTRRCRWLSR